MHFSSYRLIPAHIYISLCALSWGLAACLQSSARSFGSLIVLRALLGLGEAAFSPGIPFYLSFFYRRSELAYRVGLLISAAPLATSFASSLAWLITKIGEHGPIAPWRLLFLAEGFPSVVAAVVAWRIVPDRPETAPWLNARERQIASLRLEGERGSEDVSSPTFKESSSSRNPTTKPAGRKLHLRAILATLRSPKSYLTASLFFLANVSFSSMPVFAPSIIHALGASPLLSQALSAPPYLLAFIYVLVTAHLSDTYRTRSIPLIISSLLSTLAYLFLSLAGPLKLGPTARYVALYPATAGFFSVVTLLITWTLDNNPHGETGRGAGLALLNLVGQCGPLLGTRLYPDKDAPLYAPGMAVCAGCMFLVVAGGLTLRTVLKWENQGREMWWRPQYSLGEYEVVEGVELLEGGEGRERRKEMMNML